MNLPLCFLHEVPSTWHSVALAGRSSSRLLRHPRTYHEGIFNEVLARSGGYLLRAIGCYSLYTDWVNTAERDAFTTVAKI